MQIDLIQADITEKKVLANLLEKYMYEFSQYDGTPFNEAGLFGYHHLDEYWTEGGRFAYLIYADGKLAGFALINKHPDCDKPIDWSVAEFFVAYGYRKLGVGTDVMKRIFDRHRGYWHIKYHPKNVASVRFWTKIAQSFSDGGYETLASDDDYCDGTKPTVLFFKV